MRPRLSRKSRNLRISALSACWDRAFPPLLRKDGAPGRSGAIAYPSPREDGAPGSDSGDVALAGGATIMPGMVLSLQRGRVLVRLRCACKRFYGLCKLSPRAGVYPSDGGLHNTRSDDHSYGERTRRAGIFERGSKPPAADLPISAGVDARHRSGRDADAGVLS
jgi:hypothetical protein